MARFTEDTFNNWRYPPSTTEESKLSNAERLIKEAIRESDDLSDFSIDIFGQGSYANDTNVKLNSDIDIAVCLNNTVFYYIPESTTKEEFGYSDSDYSFLEYKNSVENALVKKFGRDYVVRNDKCITVLANTTRVEADVVPSFKYYRHDSKTVKVVGTKFITDKGSVVINYPLQHIENGKTKNGQTQKRFKRLTRIFKRVRYKMMDENIPINDNINSFLVECLVWNVPNSYFNNYDTWTDRLRESLVFLYNKTKEDKDCLEWGEVSELLYLFRADKRWTRSEVNDFLVQVWNYLEF